MKNWSQIISDLTTVGFSQSKIALECGTCQSNINALLHGKHRDTYYEIGTKLQSLHQRHFVQIQNAKEKPCPN